MNKNDIAPYNQCIFRLFHQLAQLFLAIIKNCNRSIECL